MKTLLLALFLSGSVFAQGGGDHVGNGGSGDEASIAANQAELEQTSSKIKFFFANNKSELQKKFPEFRIEALLDAMRSARLEVTSEAVIDRHGKNRTCVNYADNLTISCNDEKLSLIKSNPAAFFVLAFHEHLGLIGVEETSPEDARVVDGYSISSRLAAYVSQTSNFDLKIESELVRSKDLSKFVGGYSLKEGSPDCLNLASFSLYLKDGGRSLLFLTNKGFNTISEGTNAIQRRKPVTVDIINGLERMRPFPKDFEFYYEVGFFLHDGSFSYTKKSGHVKGYSSFGTRRRWVMARERAEKSKSETYVFKLLSEDTLRLEWDGLVCEYDKRNG